VLALLVMILSAYSSSVFSTVYVRSSLFVKISVVGTNRTCSSSVMVWNLLQSGSSSVLSHILGLSFYVFTWTILFLAYVRTSMFRHSPIPTETNAPIDNHYPSLLSSPLCLLGSTHPWNQDNHLLARYFRPPRWGGSRLEFRSRLLQNFQLLARWQERHWYYQSCCWLGCIDLAVVCCKLDYFWWVTLAILLW